MIALRPLGLTSEPMNNPDNLWLSRRDRHPETAQPFKHVLSDCYDKASVERAARNRDRDIVASKRVEHNAGSYLAFAFDAHACVRWVDDRPASLANEARDPFVSDDQLPMSPTS